MARLNILPLYLAIVGAGSIVAHIATEFAGMGSQAEGLVFSTLHTYLAVGAALCAVAAWLQARQLWSASSGGRNLQRVLLHAIEALPFRGRGCFFILTAALQFGVGLLTQIGEGCPLCTHDVVSGALGALVTVVLLALAIRALGAKLPTIAAAIFEFVAARPSGAAWAPATAANLGTPALASVWSAPLYNRPPPPLH